MPTGYESMTVAEIREKLVKEHGMSAEEVGNIKGKQSLVNTLKTFEEKPDESLMEFMGPEAEESVEVVEAISDAIGQIATAEDAIETVDETVDQIQVVPSLKSVLWHDYVMNQFDASEMSITERGTKSPDVVGLRRVVTKLIGPIIESSCKTIAVPTSDNNFRSVEEHTVVVAVTENEELRDMGVNTLSRTEVADVTPNNTKDEFLAYPLATCSTRAESRALRKILNIREPAQEELSGKTSVEASNDFVDRNEHVAPITTEQINTIALLCSRANINVMKFINLGGGQYNRIEEVKFGVARQMIMQLNNYVRGETKIPESIVGFVSDWRVR